LHVVLLAKGEEKIKPDPDIVKAVLGWLRSTVTDRTHAPEYKLSLSGAAYFTSRTTFDLLIFPGRVP
jgi:hypothetical protein